MKVNKVLGVRSKLRHLTESRGNVLNGLHKSLFVGITILNILHPVLRLIRRTSNLGSIEPIPPLFLPAKSPEYQVYGNYGGNNANGRSEGPNLFALMDDRGPLRDDGDDLSGGGRQIWWEIPGKAARNRGGESSSR